MKDYRKEVNKNGKRNFISHMVQMKVIDKEIDKNLLSYTLYIPHGSDESH